MGGINDQKWVVYDIVIPTFPIDFHSFPIFPPSFGMFHHPLPPESQENSMTIDDPWDSVEAPIWVPQVRVAAQDRTLREVGPSDWNGFVGKLLTGDLGWCQFCHRRMLGHWGMVSDCFTNIAGW